MAKKKKSRTPKKFGYDAFKHFIGTAHRSDDLVIAGLLTECKCQTEFKDDPSKQKQCHYGMNDSALDEIVKRDIKKKKKGSK